MNPALATMSHAELEHALGSQLRVKEIQLKNNKLPLQAALHRAIRHATSQKHWPLISAIALKIPIVSTGIRGRVEVVENGFTLAMIGLMLMTEPPLYFTESQNLASECVNADFTTVGRPVMFPPRDGISFGISIPRTTLEVGDAVLIYVWVNNQTDKEKVLGSCQMWWDWGVTVYDSRWHEMKTHTERDQERRGEQPFKFCVRNIALRITAHTCGPLQDMGNVKVDLREDRDLPAGEYFVTEKRLTSSGNSLVSAKPVRGLKIVITDKKTQSIQRAFRQR